MNTLSDSQTGADTAGGNLRKTDGTPVWKWTYKTWIDPVTKKVMMTEPVPYDSSIHG
jgi:hypothetical protein